MKKFIIMIFVSALFFLIQIRSFAASYNLITVSDAFTYGSSGDNFGSAAYLHTPSPYTSYLKFNLSPISDNEVISTITLRAYEYREEINYPVVIYYVVSDSWSESTITGQNKPSYTDILDATYQMPQNSWWTFDISHYNYTRDLKEGFLSVAMQRTGGSPFRSTSFYSKEASSGAYAPHLIVETSVIPEPSTFILIGVGMIVGLFRDKIKSKI